MSKTDAHRRDAQFLREYHILPRVKRFRPRKPREFPWIGRVIAIDTEGTARSGKYTATAYWDDMTGAQHSARFRHAVDFANWLISQARDDASPMLVYAHNLEWDLQVLLEWLPGTRLQYAEHMAKRDGSALRAVFDYEGRPEKRRRIEIRNSFTLWPMSLAELGKVVKLPKLRTPRELISTVIDFRTGCEITSALPSDDSDAPRCEHDRVECMECYDLRDAEILWRAMRLYVDTCNDAGISPALTRSAHAMRDFRTNYLPEAITQYTENENLRAQKARFGGRSQMLTPGLTVAGEGEIILQADVVSEYPSVMAAGNFPDPHVHHILHNCVSERVREYTGWAWCEVDVPELPIGPLVWRDERDNRTYYPVNRTLQGAWTTDELAYALDLGCTLRIARLEGTPSYACLDPFSAFIRDKFELRARYKSEGDARERSVKLDMNGLSGKFGMRWTDPILKFRRRETLTTMQTITHDWLERCDELPARYPDYLMVPWSALIMARGRLMLHRFGMRLIRECDAKLLCCDTDSWTFLTRTDAIMDRGLFGSELGQWEPEVVKDKDGTPLWKSRIGTRTLAELSAIDAFTAQYGYAAFRGVAAKEYALYPSVEDISRHAPTKARAKGIGGIATSDRNEAIDHYLCEGNIHFARPNKTRSILRGIGEAATFTHVEKTRRARAPELLPLLYDDWPAEVRRQIRETESKSLWRQRKSSTTSAMTRDC